MANLGFIPRSFDLALLFLRVAVGVSMIALHAWDKFVNFPSLMETFPDPLGIGHSFSLVLALFAELFCSALLVGGILTRFAAAVLIINLSVALFKVHGGDLSKAGGGEPAALYLYAYVAILIAGGGRFSADGAGGPFALAGFGVIAGAVLGYPLSYYFQGGDYKAQVTAGQYLTRFKTVLQDDALKGTAIGVWVGLIVLLAIVGFLVGRAMNRRVVRTVEAPSPKPPELP
jgi:putative oxidoreductase